MWQVWRQAQAFHSTPADLLGVEDALVRFYLNRAVWTYCSRVESELEKAAGAGKSKTRQAMGVNMVLHRWLGLGQFANQSRSGQGNG